MDRSSGTAKETRGQQHISRTLQRCVRYQSPNLGRQLFSSPFEAQGRLQFTGLRGRLLLGFALDDADSTGSSLLASIAPHSVASFSSSLLAALCW